MKIYKVNSSEGKEDQQVNMVLDCISHWGKLNNDDYTYYTDVMNMKTSRINNEHWCYVTLTYHHNPNKW